MNIEQKELSITKYTTISKILSNQDNRGLFNELDALLVQKRFDNAYELSLTENVMHVTGLELLSKNITKIINDFIKTFKSKKILDKRNIYEVVKVSNLPKRKLDLAINPTLYLQLNDCLASVSRETTFISCDFLILRILDNFLQKNSNKSIITVFSETKKQILKKIVDFEYTPEKREKETTFLCWLDRLLIAVINNEITILEYIILCEKILLLTTKTIYTHWKILHSLNYILLQKEFGGQKDLITYKRKIIRDIDTRYGSLNLNLEDIKNLTINTLAKKTPCKEDFYYLFDCLRITANNSETNKLFCLQLCSYIIERNTKQNIFCMRFIRNYFIQTLFNIIKITDSTKIKEQEITVLIKLFHVDVYFCFNRIDIFKNIVNILKTINDGQTKLTHHNFYRYCNALDYIMYQNTDIQYSDIVDYLCLKPSEKSKISKHFKLIAG